MGGCESCASSRRKEAAWALNESVRDDDLERLRGAIEKAESCGIDSLPARKKYAELLRRQHQAPEKVQEIVNWAASMQDGAMLYALIHEVEVTHPLHEELPGAHARLAELQEEILNRLQRAVRNRNLRSLSVALDKARHMGIPHNDLVWAEGQLASLEAQAASILAKKEARAKEALERESQERRSTTSSVADSDPPTASNE
eukprot:TRINITY_DN64224_c0_g1_i1.p1 TRINITY_DN64224_c0_g1~~TRINITY_DN64224_c0_g1_i1.p1  ORF type:complete len:201 (+),score=33.98 TRINITY_DN64224_c0_g1_i1:115-717(+)